MLPLFIRSHYSLMRGCSSPEQQCRRAKQLGYADIVLSDISSLAGLWPFLAACKKYGLRPYVASEIYCEKERQSALCLVLDSIGYTNLCNLITCRNLEKNFSLEKHCATLGKGLLVISSSLSLLKSLRSYPVQCAANVGNRPTQEATALRSWAQKYSIPLVCAPVVHMAKEEELPLFRLMESIRTNSIMPRKDGGYAVSWQEAPALREKRFAVWPEIVSASKALIGRCHFHGPENDLVMPPWSGSKESVAVSLRKAAYQGACLRYGTDLSEAVVERLEKELRVIDSMGFSSYFLVVRDIVHRVHGRKRKKALRICGRGSGAASLVAYCLKITNICPVKYNLYFERFLNPGRSDPPDIDIDFSWDERDTILTQVFAWYGTHAAMVSTIIRFQPRMALRETARAFGVSLQEISNISRQGRLPGAEKQQLPEPWPEIMKLAASLCGTPRHLSVHPGGVIITPEPVSNYVPVAMAAKGVPVIQWDKDSAEEGGLVKIDLLGNRSLGVIRDCIASLAGSGRDFSEEYWQPEEDLPTKQMIAAGKTMGCFYIESPAMRLLQQRAASGEFEQLVLQSSIIRPAANEFVREYIRRLRGGAWQHLHPKLAGVLDETFGLMVYQEDVSRVAVALAGFSHARADGLRKVMSKKDKVLKLRDYELEFDQGCAQRGVASEPRKQLWQMMLSFDGYSFCKPHSASYAKVSYQAAYLKCHYPAAFMAAVISNQGGYYSTFAYVSEAKRLGIRVLAPCVNDSDSTWCGQGDKSRAQTIRVGLMAIKELSAATMEKIVRCRKEKKFITATDFWQRVSLHKDECRTLIRAGAMDALLSGGSRNGLFWHYSQFRSLAKNKKDCPLFGLKLPDAPELPPFSVAELQQQEYASLGFLCDTHPLLLYGEQLQGRVRACDLGNFSGRRVLFGGWLLSGKMVSTKTGEVMEFLSFEDETGLVETTFFPKIYRRYAAVLESGAAYMLRGLVEEEYGALTLTVDEVKVLQKRTVS
jgi:DNA polymerase-3 subunit alpha/error-prone DNA polymerase